MFFNRFVRLMNGNPEASGGAPQGTPATPANPANPEAPANTGTPAASSNNMAFIPESYKEAAWAKKYNSPDEFFKGVDNMHQMIGKKEIIQVNGIQIPKEDATPEEMNAFYNSLGRPETADKYEYSDEIKFHEGLNVAEERKAISDIAHSLGLTKKQAEGVYKAYAERTNTFFAKGQEQVVKKLEDTLKATFGDKAEASFALAKKGAKVLEGADKINLEDVSNPVTLRALAMLGEYVGEDTFESGTPSTRDSLLKEAKELQSSDLYKKGDKATVERVQGIYTRLYPN